MIGRRIKAGFLGAATHLTKLEGPTPNERKEQLLGNP